MDISTKRNQSKILLLGSLGEGFEPQFLGEVQNVTVVLGREAVLSCSVMKLNDYKVMWTKVTRLIND